MKLQNYRVHIIASVRIPVDVLAFSETEAIEQAEKQTNIKSYLRGPAVDDENIIEFATESVDEEGEPNSHLHIYANDGTTQLR